MEKEPSPGSVKLRVPELMKSNKKKELDKALQRTKLIDKYLKDEHQRMSKYVLVYGIRGAGVGTMMRHLRLLNGYQGYKQQSLELFQNVAGAIKKLAILSLYGFRQEKEFVDRKKRFIESLPIPTLTFLDEMEEMWNIAQSSLHHTSLREVEYEDQCYSYNEPSIIYFGSKLATYRANNFTPDAEDYIHMVSQPLQEFKLASKMEVLLEDLPNVTVDCFVQFDFTRSLPLDVLVKICTYLDSPSIFALCVLNKALSKLMASSSLWKVLCQQRYNIDTTHELEWKHIFVLLSAQHPKRSGLQSILVVQEDINLEFVQIMQQYSERRKWIHQFQDKDVIFVVDVSTCFDRPRSSDYCVDLFAEQLKLFRDITQSKWFVHSNVYLLLNKFDLFTSRWKHCPIPFPEYKGGQDVQAAMHFFKSMFQRYVEHSSQLHIYVTTGHDLSTKDTLQEIMRHQAALQKTYPNDQ